MEFTGCGKIKAIGKIFTIVKAEKSNYKFRDVCFFIVKDSLPPILGKDFIIENSSTDNGNFKIHGHGMEIYLRNGMRVLFPWSETAALFKMDSGKLSTRQKLEVLEKTLNALWTCFFESRGFLKDLTIRLGCFRRKSEFRQSLDSRKERVLVQFRSIYSHR